MNKTVRRLTCSHMCVCVFKVRCFFEGGGFLCGVTVGVRSGMPANRMFLYFVVPSLSSPPYRFHCLRRAGGRGERGWGVGGWGAALQLKHIMPWSVTL